MKKIFIAFALVGLMVTTVQATESSSLSIRSKIENSHFRDVSPSSQLRPMLNWAVEEGFIEPGGFFRPDLAIPAQMFWPLVLKEAGFDPNSATFNTPLPVNIADDDPMAQYLREAIRRGFIDGEQEFNHLQEITQLEALEVIVETKALVLPTRTSNTFRRLFPKLPSRASYLQKLEAAYASKILSKYEVENFKSTKHVSRETLLTWLYRYEHEGAKASTVEGKDGTPLEYDGSIEARKEALKKRFARRTTDKSAAKKPTTIKIEVLEDNKLPAKKTTTRKSGVNFGLLEQVYSDVISKYRFQDKITSEKKKEMIEAATEAMVQALGDKYSRYVKPSLSKEFSDNLDGKFEGIGAYIEMLDGDFTITAPITGSPAEKAGIMAGDVVTHVDGVSIKDEALTDSVDRIKGPAGTSVKLTLSRNSGTREIIVVRGKITVPSVTLKWERSVPILGIHQFSRTTAEDLTKQIEGMILPKNPRGIIIDLRNNPGGFLSEAVEVGEIFLEKNKVVFSTEYENSKQVYKAGKTGLLSDMTKIIVLQNKGTASASEIVIKALQDYGRVKVIGTKSHGKGTVQSVSQYNNGGMLKITVAKWLSPNGDWLDGEGIDPDITIDDPSVKQKQEQIDPQVDRAVQELISW